jgi:hypothetical protein
LRHQGELPGPRRGAREGGVQAAVGAHDAQAVGAQDSHASQPRCLENILLECAAFGPGFTETAGEHYRGSYSRRAGVLDDPRHGARRRDDDRQVGRLRQVRQPTVRALAENFAVLGIDRVELAAQSARREVAVHDGAERALALGGADQRDAARGQQRP